MKTAGIIAEYNPFHEGHLYHITKTREKAKRVVAVMSGSFVQRGEPAVLDKWTRARAALLCGADMVIELPSLFSSASAEDFAAAGIKLLSDTGVVDSLSFGSEAGSLPGLLRIAEILASESKAYKAALKSALSEGLSYPAARERALAAFPGADAELLKMPNNILAAEYLKSLLKLGSPMAPMTIPRAGAGYNAQEIQSGFPSATALRKLILSGADGEALKGLIPGQALTLFEEALARGAGPVSLEDFAAEINYRIRVLGAEGLSEIADVTEGLEYKIIKTPYDLEEKISFLKSKRYTRTKLQRMLLHILLDVRKSELEFWRTRGYCPYIRVLGFRRGAEGLLGEMARAAAVPVITNVKDAESILSPEALGLLKNEITREDIYGLAMPVKTPAGRDYREPIIRV